MARPFTVAEIREAYLAFFAEQGATRYPSAPLVPENDPTTLFTVAGMSQFKDMFLGRGTHPFTRATTCQKCIRTNDILNVGRTARHHTFFEMLGNFSFNDYFKHETIHWAWEFLTQRLGLSADRLSVSVHELDGEAYRIWREEIGIPADRLFKLGDADNFWPANAPKEGPEGPGGCCSEIFWDHRTNADPKDNLAGNTGRFVEIWNLVFPEFNVRKPHADGSPNLENLGRRNIDTGSGLERVAAVMQGVYNNFDIDLFQHIIKRVCQVAGVGYDAKALLGAKTKAAEDNALIRRIADHVRAVTFCIADGALPSNTDRGYIVRRLIRRATLDLEKLGCSEVRLCEVVPVVVEVMGQAYPEVVRRQELARDTLKAEETLFRRTLRKGLDIFQRALERQKSGGVFSGDDAFELVTTHGFPKEIIAELAAAEGLAIDEARYQQRWAEFQKISQGGRQVEVFTATALQTAKPRLGATPFVGYASVVADTAIVLLEADGRETAAAPTGAQVRFALEKTPFYAESGGQVGDRGTVTSADFTIQVEDVQKDEGLVIHSGRVSAGTAHPAPVRAAVEATARRDTTRHHSATHLMHAALCAVLGDQVEQQGSKVEPDQLRFDFNHAQALTDVQLRAVEEHVNRAVAAAYAADIREVPIDEAKRLGAKAQFGEKYGATVRVVTFGDGALPGGRPWSREFCGGCHVANTGDIGHFRIIEEGGIAAGIRRIVAVAGAAAERLLAAEREVALSCGRILGLSQVEDAHVVAALARQFKAPLAELPTRLGQLAQDVRELAAKLGETVGTFSGDLTARVVQLQNELKRLRKLAESRQAQAVAGAVDAVIAAETVVDGVPVIAARAGQLDGKALRQLADLVKGRRPSLCLVLGAVAEGRVGLVAAVSPDLVKKGLGAGALIGKLAPMVGGKGGGKSDLAQAGGADPARLDAALVAVAGLVREQLAAAGMKR
jgi:alanyl-tRNA synthetase